MSTASVPPAVYNPKTKRWTFTSKHGNGFILRPLGTSRTLISARQHTNSVLPTGQSTLLHDRARQWTRYLMQDVPEVAPGLDFLPDLIEESQIITANTEINDPSVGKLLAVGSAIRTGSNGDSGETVQTITYATGAVGSEIGIGKVVDERFEFEGQKGVSLTAPALETSEKSAYKFASQVRQICTARRYSEESFKSLIGVRTASASVVLKQEYHSNHKNKLTCSPVFELTASNTGGSIHSDIAFNSRNENQLGVVNERGAWFVFDIHEKGKKITTGTELLDFPQGYLWGKIQWGVNENSLIVANRSRLALFDIRAQPPGISFLSVNNSAEGTWVMDFCSDSVSDNSNHILLLTSSSLVWLDVRMPGKKLLSCNHYRHPDDISLKMEVFKIKESMTALIHSRLNPLVSAFQMAHTDGIPTWLDTPYLFPINEKSRPVAFAVLPARISSPSDSKADDVFVSCFHISTDLVLRSQIYTDGRDIGNLVLAPAHKNKKDNSEEKDVHDRHQEDADSSGTEGSEDQDPDCLHTDFSALYKYAFDDRIESFKTAADGKVIDRFCTALVDSIHKEVEEGKKRVVTLFEAQQPSRLFDDLDSLSSAVEKVLTSNSDIESSSSLIPPSERYPFGGEDQLDDSNADQQELSIRKLYDRILEGWVKPLPLEVGSKVRLRRERLARMIATEVYLASKGIILMPKANNAVTQPPSQSTNPEGPVTPKPTVVGHDSPSATVPQDMLKGLRKYTYVINAAKNPTSMMSRILDQWELGEDPNNFEYGAEGQITAKRRHRVPKYKKHRGGPSEMNGLSLSPGSFKGQQPVQFAVSSASSQIARPLAQPTQVMTGPSTQVQMRGSQAVMASPGKKSNDGSRISMSQVERGKYGGRNVKKKRKQGF
ncbi:RNA polymerase I-specific transcription initiation factor RRN6-like protein [Kalaharituber pfeilii]|nr:RNA polymerase I-specific transcription initiation factor RRN6-like protein [Kalaharituber pfeilii]